MSVIRKSRAQGLKSTRPHGREPGVLLERSPWAADALVRVPTRGKEVAQRKIQIGVSDRKHGRSERQEQSGSVDVVAKLHGVGRGVQRDRGEDQLNKNIGPIVYIKEVEINIGCEASR